MPCKARFPDNTYNFLRFRRASSDTQLSDLPVTDLCPIVLTLATITDLAAVGASTSTINLTWTYTTDPTSFLLERSTSETTGFVQVATIGGSLRAFTDTGLTGGTIYYYRMRATSQGLFSDYSNTAFAAPFYDFGNGLRVTTDDFADRSITPAFSFGGLTYSLSMWIRQNALQAGNGTLKRFLTFFLNGSAGFFVSINYNDPSNGTHTVGLGTPGSGASIIQTYADTLSKVHIAAVIKATNATIYVNGVQGNTGGLGSLTTANQILVGQSVASNNPECVFGEYQLISNYEFTQADVNKIYNGGNGSRFTNDTFASSQFVYDYKFNESTGSTAADDSDNNFDLTLNNFPPSDPAKWVTF